MKLEFGTLLENDQWRLLHISICWEPGQSHELIRAVVGHGVTWQLDEYLVGGVDLFAEKCPWD